MPRTTSSTRLHRYVFRRVGFKEATTGWSQLRDGESQCPHQPEQVTALTKDAADNDDVSDSTARARGDTAVDYCVTRRGPVSMISLRWP